MGVKSFTELVAWQEAKALHNSVCEACKREPLSKRYRLVEQLKASSSSAMANIAEGFGRGSMQEFHKSLCIAKGEAAEVLSHLHSAVDDGLIDAATFAALSDQALSVGRLIGALRKSIEPWLKRKPGKR